MARKIRREIICGIYKATNLINGKNYVGQSKDILARWQSYRTTLDYTEYKNVPFHIALKEFGFDNFKFEIIHECKESELDISEIKYIKELNSCLKWENSNGYNVDEGGNFARNGRKSKRVIRKDTGEVFKSVKEAFKVTGCSDAGISKCCTGRQQYVFDKYNNKIKWEYIDDKVSIDYIKKLSEEYKSILPTELHDIIENYIIENEVKPRIHHNAIKVVCNETGKIFDSLILAGKSIGVSASTINLVAKNKQDKCKSKIDGKFYTFTFNN